MLSSILFWLLILLLLPAALVGVLFITRGTAVQHVRGTGGDSTVVSPDEPTFPLMVSLLTGAVLAPGNRVELALNGDGTFPRLWDDLRGAQETIMVQIYYAGPGEVADTLAEILTERAQAGLAVYFLYDAFGASDLPRSYFSTLRDAGIRAVAFRPIRLRTLWVAQNRSHVRGIVVDGRVGWTGGFGIDDKWLGDGRTDDAWRETNVRFEGPAVRELQAAFAAAWTEATGELFTGRVTVEERDGGLSAAGILHTAPTLGSTPAERFLALSIAGARRSLYITNAYFAPDKNFVRMLVTASRRGVDVRILAGGRSTDVPVARRAGRSSYEALMDAGVHIYEYQPSTLHAKTFVVDGIWVSVGTMNFDNRSLALNDEVSLIALDRGAGERMEELFFEDLQQAVEIDPVAFHRRPWYERVGEWAANLITRVL